jgi:hypothetical protein
VLFLRDFHQRIRSMGRKTRRAGTLLIEPLSRSA